MSYTRFARSRLGICLVLLALFAVILLFERIASASPTSADSQSQVVAASSVVRIRGELVNIEILVLVQPGENANERAQAALKSVLANADQVDESEFSAEQFTLTGLVWDTLPVSYSYNNAGVPGGLDALGALQRAHQTWNDVSTSAFEFVYAGTTTRCPSLYDGCPGAQAFDGQNDVGWDDIATNGVLGVTWYSTSIDEFDMVIDNTDFTWYTGSLPVPGGSFDLETVNLHELGHALGLSHSTTNAAIMYPSVSSGTGKRVLDQDDIDGIASLYLGTAPTATPTVTATPVSSPTATASPTATSSPTPTATPAPDTTPPAASITGPSDGDTVSGSVTFSADASDVNGIQKVRFWVDGTYLSYDLTAPYSKTWDTTAFGDGAHTLTIQAIDWAGNSTFVSINVSNDNGPDTTPPAASITGPSDGDTVSGSVTFSADASDVNGIQKVRFWVDGTYLSYDLTAPFSKTWDTTAFADGAHTLTIQAIDWAGNSTYVSINVTSDNTTPPTASITGPSDSATVSGSVSFSANASDASGIQKVRFWVDSVYLSYDLTAPYSKTWDSTVFTNGSHTLTIEAIDSFGNSNFVAINVTVDNALPMTSALFGSAVEAKAFPRLVGWSGRHAILSRVRNTQPLLRSSV